MGGDKEIKTHKVLREKNIQLMDYSFKLDFLKFNYYGT
jgi:hypothetical protein